MKFTLVIFGCQMNYADAARIKAIMLNSGFSYVDTIQDADIVIIDTCSVRQKSEDKVTGKLKEIPQDKKIWITGCMIQHNFRNAKISKQLKDKTASMLMKTGNFIGNVNTTKPKIVGWNNQQLKKLKQNKKEEGNIIYINHAFNPTFYRLNGTFPNIELFFRIDDTGFLPIILQEMGYDINPDVEIMNEYTGIIPHNTNQLFKENTKTAYVPISTGCSQFCAYCIVPYARGLEKNLPVDKIVQEANHHIQNGVEEIVLLGQIVNKHPDFVEICKQILSIPGLRRLRYTSPYPTFVSEELLTLHENEPKMCPHIHMPLQSGSDKVLKKMFRGYNANQYKKFVDDIRSLNRPISITSDIIVGFCDETEEDFQQSLELTNHAQFDMIYIGIYSPRPGTLGAKKYQDNVPKKIKKERRTRLNAILREISEHNNQKELGGEREIIINKIEKDRIAGYADNMKNVVIKRDKKNPSAFDTIINKPKEHLGHFVKTTITDGEAFKIYGNLSQI